MMIETSYLDKIGHQRDWVWRGWQIRFTYLRPSNCVNLQNPPILFIHGFGASLNHWRFNLAVLAQSHPVYAIDLLGFGASRKASTNYNVKLWTELIADFWRNFLQQPMIMVGNSLGSLVCVSTAYYYPEMVKKLTLLNLPDVTIRQEMIPTIARPIVTTIEKIFTRGIFLKPLFKILRQPAVLKRWLGIAYLDHSRIDQELINIIALPPQDDNADQAFIDLCKGVNDPHFCLSMKQMLPKINLPILLIWGQKDCMIPPALGSVFASLNPQIKLIELENVGHCPHDEVPDHFNQILLNYCQV